MCVCVYVIYFCLDERENWRSWMAMPTRCLCTHFTLCSFVSFFFLWCVLSVSVFTHCVAHHVLYVGHTLCGLFDDFGIPFDWFCIILRCVSLVRWRWTTTMAIAIRKTQKTTFAVHRGFVLVEAGKIQIKWQNWNLVQRKYRNERGIEGTTRKKNQEMIQIIHYYYARTKIKSIQSMQQKFLHISCHARCVDDAFAQSHPVSHSMPCIRYTGRFLVSV